MNVLSECESCSAKSEFIYPMNTDFGFMDLCYKCAHISSEEEYFELFGSGELVVWFNEPSMYSISRDSQLGSVK